MKFFLLLYLLYINLLSQTININKDCYLNNSNNIYLTNNNYNSDININITKDEILANLKIKISNNEEDFKYANLVIDNETYNNNICISHDEYNNNIIINITNDEYIYDNSVYISNNSNIYDYLVYTKSNNFSNETIVAVVFLLKGISKNKYKAKLW